MLPLRTGAHDDMPSLSGHHRLPLMSLSLHLQLQAAALAQSVGEEITQMLAEQKKLDSQYVALVADQAQLRNLPNKNKLIENQKAVYAVTEQIRQGTQALVRNLKVGIRSLGSLAASAVTQRIVAAIPALSELPLPHPRAS